MGVNGFSEYANELPPFKDYLQLMFNNKGMVVKNRTTGMLVAHLAVAKRELFNPKKNTNIKSTARNIFIVTVGMPQMKKELIDIFKEEIHHVLFTDKKRRKRNYHS